MAAQFACASREGGRCTVWPNGLLVAMRHFPLVLLAYEEYISLISYRCRNI